MAAIKNGFNFPSPDSSGNPYVPGFGTKDWNELREKAPKNNIKSKKH